MFHPILSIVIATYNSEKTLCRALESVSTQSFQDWECIIVDGASKDHTIEIVRDFESKDDRFRHISEPDYGIYDAFNKGWKMAMGEWVYYLGSDDKLTEDGFAQLFKQELNVDAVGGGVYLVRKDERPKPQYTHGFDGCHQGFIMRRSLIVKMKGFNEKYKILADADLKIRCELSNQSVKNTPILIAYFTVGGVSQSFKSLNDRVKERYYIFKNTGYTKRPFVNCLFWYLREILVYLKHRIYKQK